jgi:hypothetical protein
MAEIRTLKLNLLADVDQFTRGMKGARGDVDNLGYKLGSFAKDATKYFAIAAAAAGAYAIKIGIDGVKAAAEDEKSSRILEEQLYKTVGANKALVNSVENYIGATQKRVGIQDDKLRPSFARLLRSTEDVAKAQDLLNLALDISVATGKDVDTVSAALGKAYDGNTASLGRLGLGIDNTILKSGDLNLITETLRKNFGGFADKEALTFDGRLRILNVGIDELKENIGFILLPVFERLVSFANEKLIPTIQEVIKGFRGQNDTDGLTGTALKVAKAMGYDENTPGQNLGRSLYNVAQAMERLIDALTDPSTAEGISNLDKIANGFQKLANGIDRVANAWSIFKQATGAQSKGFGLMDSVTGYNPFLGFAGGGSVSAGMPVTVGEMGKEVFVPSSNGRIVPNNQLGGTTIINLNGIIDAESARRSIEKLLQNSARRTGAINLVGATL